jgi:hypothetical protein
MDCAAKHFFNADKIALNGNINLPETKHMLLRSCFNNNPHITLSRSQNINNEKRGKKGID